MVRQGLKEEALTMLLVYKIAGKIMSYVDSSDESSDDDDTLDPVYTTMSAIIAQRYLNPREPIPKSSEDLQICLTEWKEKRPELFQIEARMYPAEFDELVKRLKDEPIFSNNSPTEQEQLPVETQLMIALRRFESGEKVHTQAMWAGVGYGTVDLCTRRVLQAIHTSSLKEMHVRWPVGQEREEAKQWAETQACPAWKDGWCMVDGTLIPLYSRPRYYGDLWFDRKSNYSMNVQVINTPNLKIIDYASGFRGSQHDAHCFKYTQLAIEREQLLARDEWVWADVGYKLQTWCLIPYKHPGSLLKENKDFNYHLSKIRIKSEHAIGYLKGRFQSLKKLRVNIHTKKDIVYATGWINACIILHSFCMDQKLDLQKDFLRDGLEHETEQQKFYQPVVPVENESDLARKRTLTNAMEGREILKEQLFAAIGR